jgi:glycosyltransferase involved in cell wall biosynthesis
MVTVLNNLSNKAPFVKATVQSILDNTFKDLEYLVVDDASTDGGLELVKEITDPRLKILESPVNTGRAATANRGYDAAQGDYVAVLDADDIAVPERLAKQVSFLDSHPDVGVVGSWAQTFGSAHGTIKRPASDQDARAMALFGVPVLYPSSMFRRSVLERHHVRCDPDWLHPGMDRLFLINVGRHAQYANLQEVLLHYRVGTQNMRHGRDGVSDMHHLYRAVFDLFGIPVNGKQIALQTLFHPELDATPPALLQLVELAHWKKELIKINRQYAFFPVQEFESYVEHRWQNLFHQIVQTNAPNAFLHMWLSGQMKERAGYWAKVTSRRWFKRPFN